MKRFILGIATAAGLALPMTHAQDVGDIELLAYWDFENTGEDAWNGHAGTLNGAATYTDGGRFGFALDTSALEGSYFLVDTESAPAFFDAYNGADGPSGRDQVTYAFWQRNLDEIRDAVAFWTASPSSSGTERGAQAHTPWSNDRIYFDTAGCCEAGQRTEEASGVQDWMSWNHFAFVKNGATKQIWVNGELIIEGDNPDPLPDDMDRLFIGNGIEENRDQPGLMDEFAVIAGAASEEQIKTLADGASVIEIFDLSDPNFSIGRTVSLGQLPAISGPQELSFTFKNTGDTQPLNISSATIVSGDTDHFTLVSAPDSVPAESIGEVILSFDAKGQFRQFQVMVEFQTNDPDVDDQMVTVPVRALVRNPVGPIAHYPLNESSIADPAADINAAGAVNSGEYRENTGSIILGQDGLQDGTGTSATFNGGSALTVTTLPENSLQSFTLAMWINPASLGDLGASDFRTIVAKGLGNPAFGLLEASGELIWFGEADGTADALFLSEGLGLEAGTTYHVAMRYDHTTATGSIWLDGVEVASGDVPSFEDAGFLYAGAFGEGALPFSGSIDDIQLYDDALAPEDVQWLMDHPGEGLRPLAADSDGDGLPDEDELNTHGTDPFNADSDGDGLSDGDEIALGTNPNNLDSDGDGFSDGLEVTRGTDPLVADSLADLDLRAAWEFNTPVAGTDVPDDKSGIHGILQDSATISADGEGRSGEPGDSALDLREGTSMKVEDVAFFNELAAGDVITVVFWQKLTEVTNQSTFKGQSPSSSGAERGWSVHTPWQGNDTIFFDTSGCCDGATQRMSRASPEGIDYTEWHHFGFVKLGTTKQIWIDGVLHHEAENESPLPTDFTALWIGSAIDGIETTVGWLDDVAIFGAPLPATAFAELAAGTRPTELGGETPENVLVGHWPLDDADGATTAVDATGAHPASVGEGISFGLPGANAATGTAAQFTGQSGLQAEWSAALNPENFTFTAWVNITDTADWNSVVTSREDNGTTVNGLILYNTPEGQWDFWTGAGGATGAWQRNMGSDAVTDEWTHLAITYDSPSDTKILYVNGEEDARAEGQGYVPNGTTEEFQRPFNIGAGQDFGDGFFFIGLIDDVSIWNGALEPEVIGQIMANGVAAVAGGGGGDVTRSSLGAVAGSEGPRTVAETVDLGDLSGDATYEFSFNALKDGPSTAIVGNEVVGLKLDQWNEQGIFGITQFGDADHIFTAVGDQSVASVFGEDVHVVIVNDTTAGETRLYINGVQAGEWAGNFELAGEANIMAARIAEPVDFMGEGSVMHGWATYNTALSGEAIASLTSLPFPDDGGVQPPDLPTIGTVVAGPNSVGFSFTGAAGKTYDIEYSIDLQGWNVILSGLSGEIEFEDTDAVRLDLPEGYYRAIEN